MEYPGAKFTKKYRSALLVVFVTAFFILAPIMIIYAMGYRYDKDSNQIIGRGALSVDINPNTGNVYLNDIKLKKNIFNKKVEIKNIVPKKYTLTIETDGYYNWKKEIEIKGNKTVYIKEINLIKKNTASVIIDQDIENFYLSYDKNYIAYVSKINNKKTLYLWDKVKNQSSKIKDIEDTVYDIKWATTNNCAYYSTQNKPIEIFCIDGTEIKKTQINSNLQKIDKLQWKNNNNDPEIYYETNKTIYSLNPLTNQTQKITTSSYMDWFFDGSQLWTLQFVSSTFDIEIIKDTLGFKSKFKTIKPVGSIPESDIEAKQRYSIIIAQNNNILLKDSRADKMIIVNKDKEFILSGDKFLLSSHNDWWIIWNTFEMWTYIENNEPELQIRSGENLKQVYPMDEYNALSLIWDKKTTYLYPYYLVEGNLLDFSLVKAESDPNERTVFFTKKDQKGLWQLHY